MAVDIFNEDVPAVKIKQYVSVEEMVRDAKTLVANNKSAYEEICSLYATAKQVKSFLESSRKKMTEPFRKKIATINDKAKKLTEPLDVVIELTKSKIAAYHKLIEEIKRKEEEKIREAASLFDAQDEIYIAPLDKTITTESTIAFNRTEKKFKVVDISKVPAKYLMVDEKAVMQDLKLGINEVPGLEIYEETTTQLRVR